MLAAVMISLNYLFVFGAVTLPHLTNPVFFWIWLLFVISAFVVTGFGLANLIRGGFFKKLKAREARLRLTNVEHDPSVVERAPRAVENTPRASLGGTAASFEEASVTETTTRELEPVPRATKRV